MSTDSAITDEQKEVCATLVMRTMLTDYCTDTGAVFADELLKFAQSNTYDALYDFSTGLWREGPDYLADIYKNEQQRQ